MLATEERWVFRLDLKTVSVDLRWWRREFQREGLAFLNPREARAMLIRGYERRLIKTPNSRQVFFDRWHISKNQCDLHSILFSSYFFLIYSMQIAVTFIVWALKLSFLVVFCNTMCNNIKWFERICMYEMYGIRHRSYILNFLKI